MIIDDFDNDSNLDILAAGNLFNVEIVTPRNDSGIGVLLKGDGKGQFIALPYESSGFFTPGEVRSLALIHSGSDKMILTGNNNDTLQIFRVK